MIHRRTFLVMLAAPMPNPASGMGAECRSVLGSGINEPDKADIHERGTSLEDDAVLARAPYVTAGLTVQIPSDFATLQAAVDALKHYTKYPGRFITLNIESGHSPTTGLTLADGDFSHFLITADDPQVNVTAFTDSFVLGTNSALPVLGCLVSAAGTETMQGGYHAREKSTGLVLPGCGVKNTWGTGLYANQGSIVRAYQSRWDGCAQNGTTGACIHAFGAGSGIFADNTSALNSGFYGVQASHGGILSFQDANASGAHRHGIRASDMGIIDANGAAADDCGNDASGSNVRAYEGGMVNFVNGHATGSGADNLFAFGAGAAINARGATATGATRYGAYAEGGATINIVGGTVSGGSAATRSHDSLIIKETGTAVGHALEKQTLIISGGDVFLFPGPYGRSYVVVDTEGSAASDNLDRLRPATGYVIPEGYEVTIVQQASARDVTFRDVATSGAASYGFQLPTDTSVTLANSVDVIKFVFLGTHWSLISKSLN